MHGNQLKTCLGSCTASNNLTDRPHCVYMQERNIQTSAEWRQQMLSVDVSIVQSMRDDIKGGFDEERYGPRIGFGNLKR